MFPKLIFAVAAVFILTVPTVWADATGSTGKSFLEILFNQDDEDPEVIESKSGIGIEAADIFEDHDVELETAIDMKQAADEIIHPVLHKTAIPRESFIFFVEGEGWTIEDYSDAEGSPAIDLRYSGREYIGGNTFFTFYPFSEGRYLIKLRKNNYTSGVTERQVIEVDVKTSSLVEDVFNDATGDNPESEIEVEFEAASDVKAGPEMIIEAPEAAEAAEPIETAIDIAVAADAEETASCMDKVEQLEELLEAGSGNAADELLFELAGIYETCPEIRDERKAVEYYKIIVDNYPISNYWAEAKAKIIYLERTYIYIR
ncbi:MAG: hypothetical protein PQJ61_03555 [Spirochaetales bacterium]|uniref:Tetratricopeptide repeat protein n=1 Tax=Candidatus Thalassospirochaeta sargassi TaxID=3119039 RepID=A0AAJ1IAV3_9SPIO|nr:hypothetical protein [Spirochaetales bacterium]